ncbi:MAG: S1 RNA-binding domain-containing protein [Lachnospiraceae bacterium]|jgi:predicted RNA-binding protein (virulence factor B family)|nr:S1 RNA-binding domain-containing protein [Lachnospiraceae bacterium]
MIEIGKVQKLKVVKSVEFGIYLADPEDDSDSEERVLLPKKQIPEGTVLGDEIEVFIYRDSEDRLIATTNRPRAAAGEIARMRVKEIAKPGAFLDWGLEKDLMLPFKEQTGKIKPGDECLVAVYVDKSGRLCATMNVYECLRTDSPYKKDDAVTGTLYEISDNFGAFVAVDDIYSGLIPRKEMYGELHTGDTVQARVTNVKEDGKLDLSVREKSYIQMDDDAAKLLEIIESFAGVLPFSDKADPAVIRRETGMSKNQFKRAAGRLYKEHKVEITDTCIRRVNES